MFDFFKKKPVASSNKNQERYDSNRRLVIKNIERAKSINITHMLITFEGDDYYCKNMLKVKKKYNNKKVPIDRLPILPLESCVNCKTCHVFSYSSVIKGF